MVIRLPGTSQSWLDKEVAKKEEERFSVELDEARKSGRYPLHVAATLIAQAAGPLVSPARIEECLILAARDKSLPVYDIHQTMRWHGVVPFFGLLVVYWDDLNTWLKKNEPRIGPIFQGPCIPVASVQTKPQTEESQNGVVQQLILENWKMLIQAQAAIIWR